MGCLSYKFTSPARRGVPDQMYIYEGVVFFIEYKAPGETLRKLQAHTIKVMRKHGATVYVIDDIEEGRSVIDVICSA